MNVQLVSRQALETQERGGRITTAASKPAASRNAFLQLYPDAAFPSPRANPTSADAINKVGWAGGDCRVLALNYNARPRSEFQAETVVKGYCLIDGPYFMVSVGALAEDFQAEIDFGKSTQTDG